MPAHPVTRVAPTPSGYLHLGNAVNAQLTGWLADQVGATVALRIDDVDAARARPAYVRDIFRVLAWLGIDWAVGPRDVDDYAVRGTQAGRAGYFREALDTARAAGLEVYACMCSRRVQAGPATGGCVGGCRERGIPAEVGRTALRAHVPRGTVVDVGGSSVDVATELGDVVLWRRDDLPAYHLVSVVEDRDLGTTHIVRGADLLTTTALQVFLAPFLDARTVADATYLHHPLVHDATGAKLSKSQVERGEPLPATAEMRDRVQETAAELAPGLGITPR